MVFQIPLPAYMAYMVFLVSHEQRVGTLITAVAGAVAATLAVALSLLFYTLDASEPALRLALMAASTFVAFFLARISTIGPIAFLAGFVLVLTQTLIDDMPSPEALTRLVLWLWVIVTFPAALTTLVDLAFGRDPAKLALRTALRVLDAVAGTLRGNHSIDVDEQQAAALELLELAATCPDGGPAPPRARESRSPHYRTAGRASHAASSISAQRSRTGPRGPHGCVQGMPTRPGVRRRAAVRRVARSPARCYAT